MVSSMSTLSSMSTWLNWSTSDPKFAYTLDSPEVESVTLFSGKQRDTVADLLYGSVDDVFAQLEASSVPTV